mgnify:CR=1 FL=1
MDQTLNMTDKESNYGSDQIKVLEGLEAVRKRPGMYIGGTGVNALHHLVYETVDNSIDEAMAHFASVVSVSIQADGSCTVIDDGRGIPVEPMRHEDPALNGKPAVEIVMTKLHAGGKFQQEDSAYKVSGGLHGVGVSCVNALSEWLECEVWRDGKVYKSEFGRGVVQKPLHVVGELPQAGHAGQLQAGFDDLPRDRFQFPDAVEPAARAVVPQPGGHDQAQRRACRRRRQAQAGDVPRDQRPGGICRAPDAGQDRRLLARAPGARGRRALDDL